ncbi:MAG: response regulator transcription factor [Methylococcales bacterium]|jgi:two-component system, OmpR family, alkaline phosphatase synthesis response regulator PhoP|nr:response regulator transcription factor [Methylococcales bacterium]
MKVLIAEDEDFIRKGLSDILTQEGYDVVLAADGQQAIELYQQQKIDFICLDIMMPKMNGYDVCREIRKTDENIPIIFISAKAEEIDKVIGLELGADDYILKPFGVKEVIARIRAVTRRCLRQCSTPLNTELDNNFFMDDLEILPLELIAKRHQNNIELSLRDLKILRFFKQHKNEVIDRDALFNACWGHDYFPSSRTLDQHISKLRKRIEINSKDPKIIKTVHGAGYQYNEHRHLK